jgi:hypothetical protein
VTVNPKRGSASVYANTSGNQPTLKSRSALAKE